MYNATSQFSILMLYFVFVLLCNELWLCEIICDAKFIITFAQCKIYMNIMRNICITSNVSPTFRILIFFRMMNLVLHNVSYMYPIFVSIPHIRDHVRAS